MSSTSSASSCCSTTGRRRGTTLWQANGLSERLVKTIKGGVTKYGSEKDRRTWDEWLPWLVMGYRMSPQAALAQGILPTSSCSAESRC